MVRFNKRQMKTMIVYDCGDETSEEYEVDIEKDIFRKVLDINIEHHMTELQIAKILHANPLPNVVKVYSVGEQHYDMELLDDTYQPFIMYKDDLVQGLDQLHAHNIVYLDIKSDNIGFSHEDKVYKLFDFDCSGVVQANDPRKWLYRPSLHSNIYQSLMKNEDDLHQTLYELDNLALKKAFHIV